MFVLELGKLTECRRQRRVNGDFAADRILRKLDLITIVRHDDFGIVNCNHGEDQKQK
jgi:hypothetical protein